MVVCESLVDIERTPAEVDAFLRDLASQPAAGLFAVLAVPGPGLEVALRSYAGGTRVLVRVESEAGAELGLDESSWRTILRRRLAAELVTLREVLEAEPTPVP